jgi:hypothetical protein
MGLFILFELQLIFGKQFTTFHIVGPLHLSDLVLAILAISGLVLIIVKKITLPLYWPLFGLLGISFIYLIYSFSAALGPLNYIIRHYALFIYLGLSFIIFYSFADDEKQKINVRFILLMGILALVSQILFHGYNFATVEGYYTQLFSRFNYWTELVMPGLVIIEVWALCFLKKNALKIITALSVLFLSTTLGHASAFLACFVPIIIYFLLIFKIKHWIIITSVIVSMVSLFIFLPQFSDVNAMWRILYWREILKEGFLNYYGVFGHGFGGAFITESMNQTFLNELGSIHFDVNPEEKFLTPMHNSFVTIMFHIGIIPGLLIFVPLKNAFQWAFNYKIEHAASKKFLFLSFMGFVVWASFNVILEMPHSSAFFWFIYFSVLYEFRDPEEKNFSFRIRKD